MPAKTVCALVKRRYFHLIKKQLAGRFCALYDESKRKPGAPAAGRGLPGARRRISPTEAEGAPGVGVRAALPAEILWTPPHRRSPC